MRKQTQTKRGRESGSKRVAPPAAKNPPLRLEYVEAGSLTPNPMNWRRHGPGQVRALKAVMKDVGWAGALLYNETTKRLIDGHARRDAVPPRTPVPVLIGRWTEDQERKILATLDPLAAMAEADGDALESLLAETDLEGADLAALVSQLDDLAEGPIEEEEPEPTDRGHPHPPARNIAEIYQVIVECRDEKEQRRLYQRLKAQGLKCKCLVI